MCTCLFKSDRRWERVKRARQTFCVRGGARTKSTNVPQLRHVIFVLCVGDEELSAAQRRVRVDVLTVETCVDGISALRSFKATK